MAVPVFRFGAVPGVFSILLGGWPQTTILATPVPDGTDLEIVVNPRASSSIECFNSLHDLAGAPAGGASRRPDPAVP